MKLKDTFITHMADEEQFLIDVGGANFVGVVRSNETAAFIVDHLKTETTKNAIVEAMCKEYDAPQEIIANDVDKIIVKLRAIGALDE